MVLAAVNLGFRRKERTVEPARVALYAFSDSSNEQATALCEQGGTYHE